VRSADMAENEAHAALNTASALTLVAGEYEPADRMLVTAFELCPPTMRSRKAGTSCSRDGPQKPRPWRAAARNSSQPSSFVALRGAFRGRRPRPVAPGKRPCCSTPIFVSKTILSRWEWFPTPR
jgi:hypothetical protein